MFIVIYIYVYPLNENLSDLQKLDYQSKTQFWNNFYYRDIKYIFLKTISLDHVNVFENHITQEYIL